MRGNDTLLMCISPNADKRRKETDEMPLNQTPEKPRFRPMDPVPVRYLHTLRNQQVVRLAIPQPHGVPSDAFGIILDAHNRRHEQRFRKPDPTTTDTAILRRLANLRSPSRQFNTDPLFWMLRVRHDLWKASLSYADIRSGTPLHRADTLPPVPAEDRSTSPPYRAMAVWAHRLRGIQPDNSALYDGLFAQGETTRLGIIRDTTTRHWFYWTAAVRGFDREEASDLAYRADLFHP